MRKLIVLLVVVVVGVGVPPAAAGATGSSAARNSSVAITTCGQVITTNAVLRTDLVCAGDGLIVEASNLTVRLEGHSITSADGTGVGIRLGFPSIPVDETYVPGICVESVVVRGGTIAGFADGLSGTTRCAPDGPELPASAAISGMNLVDNGWGLDLGGERPGFSLTVDHTSIVGPNGIGPACMGPCGGVVHMSRSTIDVTSPTGISVAHIETISSDQIDSTRFEGGTITMVLGDISMSNSRFTGVTVFCGGDGGFKISNSDLTDSTVSSESACDVGLDGDRIVGPGSGTAVNLDGPSTLSITNNRFSGWDTAVEIANAYEFSITGNSFRHNGTGVATCTGARQCWVMGTISDNRFIDNRGTGLLVTVGNVHIGSNIAVGNGGLGIDAEGSPLTVIDDGGNIARHNQPPQCVGVICTP